MTVEEYQRLLRRAADTPTSYVKEENAVLRLSLLRKGQWPTLGSAGSRGPWGSKTMYYTREQVMRLLERSDQEPPLELADIRGELLSD